MDSPHVSIERAVAFLLYNADFDVSEEEHLLRCIGCQRMVLDALTEDLDDFDEDEEDLAG
jgi:hypothetical protein